MNKLIKQAIETEKPRFSVRDYLGGAEALTTTSALLYLITYDYALLLLLYHDKFCKSIACKKLAARFFRAAIDFGEKM